MNMQSKKLSLRASVLAVHSALALLALGGQAHAADAAPDDAVTALTTPGSSLELGGGWTSEGSAKAHEYSGMRGKGPFLIGNVDLRGGAAYDSDDATRWRLKLRDLGLEKRGIDAEYGNQGRYRLDLHYDEWLRQRSDSYMTPYLGAGSNLLTLPSGWLPPLVPRLSTVVPAQGTAGGANARGLSPDVTNANGIVAGVSTPPTAPQLATAANIQGTDLPMFNSVDLGTRRVRYGLGTSIDVARNWQFAANLIEEHKTGLKPMGTVTRYTNGDMSATIPDLIDQNTEQLNVGLTYATTKATFNVAYYGSLFVNNVPSMSWANWALPGNVQTMSTAPSNQFHQLSTTGSYAFTSQTRLTGNLAYGRSTQDEAFLTDVSTPLVPSASLHGLIVSTTANLKLVTRPMKAVSMDAAYKFDERDNRTPVQTYGYYDAGEAKTGTSLFVTDFPGLGANANINANRPYSKRLNQLEANADYAYVPGQAVKVGGEYQSIDRYCRGSWIDCVDAAKTGESTLRAEWRLNPMERFGARVGLSTARRKVAYNEDAFLALVPAAKLSPTGAGGATAYGVLTALGLTGYGPVLGLPTTPLNATQAIFFPNNNALANAQYGNQNRISELPGMRRYNMADRDRTKLRTSVSWQADERLSLQAGLDLNNDRYGHSVYGLKSAKGTALNLDGTFTPSEKTSLTLFYSFEDQRSRSAGNTYTANSATANVGGFTAIEGGCFATIALRNASNKIDPCLDWSADMRDKIQSIGLTFAKKEMFGGALDASLGLTYSEAKSDIGVTGGSYVNNPLAVAGAALGTTAAFYIPASALPTVKTDTTEVKINLRYAFAKDQAFRFGYIWQHMKAQDWAYAGLQVGGLSGVLPTSEKLPTYNVNTVGVSYVYSFR